MSERIYRALKKAKRRADDPCRFEGMTGDRDPRFTGLIMPVTTEFSR